MDPNFLLKYFWNLISMVSNFIIYYTCICIIFSQFQMLIF